MDETEAWVLEKTLDVLESQFDETLYSNCSSATFETMFIQLTDECLIWIGKIVKKPLDSLRIQ